MAVKKPAPETYADKLAAIIANAPALRAAGVTSVGGEVAFTLAPAEPPASRERKPPEPEPDLDDVDAFRGTTGAPS